MKRWMVIGTLVGSTLFAAAPAWSSERPPESATFGEKLEWARTTKTATKAEWDHIDTLLHIGKELDTVSERVDRAVATSGGLNGRQAPSHYIKAAIKALPTDQIGLKTYNLLLKTSAWSNGKEDARAMLRSIVSSLEGFSQTSANEHIIRDLKTEYAPELATSSAIGGHASPTSSASHAAPTKVQRLRSFRPAARLFGQKSFESVHPKAITFSPNPSSPNTSSGSFAPWRSNPSMSRPLGGTKR